MPTKSSNVMFHEEIYTGTKSHGLRVGTQNEQRWDGRPKRLLFVMHFFLIDSYPAVLLRNN